MSKEKEPKSIPKFLTPWSPIRRVPGTHLVESEEALEEKARAFDEELDRLESLGIPRMVEQGPTPELMGLTIRPSNYKDVHGSMIYNPVDNSFDYTMPTSTKVETKKPGEIDWINNPVTLAVLWADLGRLGVKGAMWALPRVLGKRPIGKAMLIRNMMSSAKPNFTPNPGYTRIVQPNGKVRFRLPSHTDAQPREFVLEPTGDNKYNMHMRIWDDPVNHVAGSITPQERDMLLEAVSNEVPVGAELAFPTSTPEMLGTRGTTAIAKRFRTPESLPGDGIWEPGTKGSFLYVRDPKTGAVETVEGNGWIKTGNKSTRFVQPQSSLYLRASAKHLLPENSDILPMYTGKTHSITEILNPDKSVNFERLELILNENADFWGGNRMRARTENPKWHKADPTTYHHTLNVVRSAWGMPVPEGYTRRQFSLASALHDAGKIFTGEGHGRIGADYFKLVFPDMDDAVYNAIYHHMEGADDALTQAVKAADINNGTHMARISEAERLGIPKGERNIRTRYINPLKLVKNITSRNELASEDPSLDSRKRMEYLIGADPYFKSLDVPVERTGPYGTEYLYGTRKANPWQLAMAQDMKQRIANYGFDMTTPIPAIRNGVREVIRPGTYVDYQASAPIDMITSSDIPSNISGYYWPKTGRNVYRVRPFSNGPEIQRVLIHESLMHGTDDLVRDLGMIPSTDPTAGPTGYDIPWIYKLWADKVNALSEPVSKDSKHWYELRATLGELRTWLYKSIARSKGKDFYKEATITPELRAEFEKSVDKLDHENMMNLLSGINDYGKDYAKVLENEYKGGGYGNITNYLESLKSLIKYAPVFYLGQSVFPSNYVDLSALNIYKRGGSIHIKPENKGKFTETKKRTGKTTEELTHSKNPLTRKRAIFALNAKKWKH